MTTDTVRILHITIDVPLGIAYEFTHRPENFPKWAAGMSKTLHQTAQGWVAGTPNGEAIVEFTPRNEYGVLDHRVSFKDKPVIYIPLRMIANGNGCEVELVLFRQPEMTDKMFEDDAGLVNADLNALKKLLESL